MHFHRSPIRLVVCVVLALCFVTTGPSLAYGAQGGRTIGVAPEPGQTPDGPHVAYLPIVAGPAGTTNPPPNAQREAAAALYRDNFLPALSAAPQWTGNIEGCVPGLISAARLVAIEKQINYFRMLAGVPPIALEATMNARAQAAALIMAAAGNLSHSPPSSWPCYTEEGSSGAGQSNLGLSYGYDIRESVVRFMLDDGANNLAVGHREWLLAPPTTHMGAGEVQGAKWDAYAVNVVDPEASYFGQWPQLRDGFVAWPPPGWVPRQVAFARWSYFLRDADFGAAKVVVLLDERPVPVSIVYAETGGLQRALSAWNALVWEPRLELDALDWSVTHSVKVAINNVKVGDATQDFNYEVLLFDPER